MRRWKEKLLNQARKKVLIKDVLQSLPTYVMLVFMLPKTLYDELTYDLAILVVQWGEGAWDMFEEMG